MFIVFILASALVWWVLTARKFLNPYKLYFIFGPKGSGKTTLETKLAYRYLIKGWNVYTDMPELLLPGVRFFDWRDLGDFVPEKHSAVFLGEVGTKFDKRNFKNFKPTLRDFFVFQRKYQCRVYMDSQSYDVDLKIRDRCDAMYLCKPFLVLWSVAWKIEKKPTIVEASAEGESRIADNLRVLPIWDAIITYLPAWVKLFDSSYVIDAKEPLKFSPVEYPDMPKSRKARKLVHALAKFS